MHCLYLNAASQRWAAASKMLVIAAALLVLNVGIVGKWICIDIVDSVFSFSPLLLLISTAWFFYYMGSVS